MIDLSQAYHQMPIDKESQELTAFTYGNKQYKLARAPFGLKPLTSIFQRAMSELFRDLNYAENYVNDIIIHSKDSESHLAHVTTVVKRLTEVGLIINQEKCHFMSTEVLLLGFISQQTRAKNTKAKK